MVNLLLFQYKYLGSIALKCGASHFGFRSVGHFSQLQQLVIIFKSRSKRWNFLGWLEGALERSQYYHREVHHKGERLFLVFINTHLFIKSNTSKIYFSNFRQLCRTQELTVYESSHPTKRDYAKVPQIKIKNQKLEEYGFTPCTEFKVIYTKNKILLKVIHSQ